jgi:hypothetical protein
MAALLVASYLVLLHYGKSLQYSASIGVCLGDVMRCLSTSNNK